MTEYETIAARFGCTTHKGRLEHSGSVNLHALGSGNNRLGGAHHCNLSGG
jgi:hypothetical protein